MYALFPKNTSTKSHEVTIHQHLRVTDRRNVTNGYKQSQTNDVISNNISQVLDNLLKDYESSQLPTYGKGTRKTKPLN